MPWPAWGPNQISMFSYENQAEKRMFTPDYKCLYGHLWCIFVSPGSYRVCVCVCVCVCMCVCVLSYVWQHLDIGYVQGMCDLLAPLLVILDDGTLTLSFTLFKH